MTLTAPWCAMIGFAAAEASGCLSPSMVIADRAGAVLYMAEATANQVAVVDAASGTISRSFVAGHTPLAPVVTPDGATLFVCNRFNNEVAVISCASGAAVARIAVPREPIAAVLTPDGGLLVVAHHLPAYAPDDPWLAARVTLIDTRTTSAVAHVLLPQGSMGARGVCVSPDGRYAYVTHTLGHFQVPTTQLERGWMNTSALKEFNAGDTHGKTSGLTGKELDDLAAYVLSL